MDKRGRPKNYRRVSSIPPVDYFKPRGIPLTALEVTTLSIEEVEAIRLADFEGLEQSQAAERMSVSRRTLARDLNSAHKKIADALLHAKAIQIEGGRFLTPDERLLECESDGHTWKQKKSSKKQGECPECGSKNVRTSR